MTEATAVAVRPEQPALTPFQVIEQVITKGDIAQMTPDQRVAFYWRTCESLGLNPLTRPFEFISLNGKLVMYARKDATDQLRKINAVTVTEIRRDKDDDLGLLTVYARGRDRTGREDEATGVVNIKGLSGDALANAVMKAETKAKRRLTLSLVGLGFLDESELEAPSVDVDPTTGEIRERAKPASLLEKVAAQREALEGGDASQAGVAQEEHGASSAEVAGSTPAPRSTSRRRTAKAEKAGDVVDGQAAEVGPAADMSFETEAKADAVGAAAAAPAKPAPLTGVEFMRHVGAATDRGVTHELVRDIALELFPKVKSLSELSDDDRAALWAAIEDKLADAGR